MQHSELTLASMPMNAPSSFDQLSNARSEMINIILSGGSVPVGGRIYTLMDTMENVHEELEKLECLIASPEGSHSLRLAHYAKTLRKLIRTQVQEWASANAQTYLSTKESAGAAYF